jgi:putative tricarboxylic transport membrane protein
MSDEKKTFDFAPKTLGAGFIHKKDLVLAIILVAFGAFMYYEAGKFPEAPTILGDTLNADVFPKMLITILFILVAIIPFEFKITPAKIAKIDKDRGDRTLPITWFTIVLLLVIVSFAEFLGAVVTMFITCLALPLLWGERNYIAVAIYSVVFPGFVYLLFNKLLGLYFNPGILELLK